MEEFADIRPLQIEISMRDESRRRCLLVRARLRSSVDFADCCHRPEGPRLTMEVGDDDTHQPGSVSRDALRRELQSIRCLLRR